MKCDLVWLKGLGAGVNLGKLMEVGLSGVLLGEGNLSPVTGPAAKANCKSASGADLVDLEEAEALQFTTGLDRVATRALCKIAVDLSAFKAARALAAISGAGAEAGVEIDCVSIFF